jgi:hypothetical protein
MAIKITGRIEIDAVTIGTSKDSAWDTLTSDVAKLCLHLLAAKAHVEKKKKEREPSFFTQVSR